MKRKITSRPPYYATIGDIQLDLSQRQLAALGSVAMNYNEMEAWIDALFREITGLPDEIALEVSTRINGIDGKIAVVAKGAQFLNLDPAVLRQVQVTLGDEGFKLLKKLRDTVVHARVFNAPLGVGIKIDRQARIDEVLITAEALEAVSERIVEMRMELMDLFNFLLAARLVNDLAADDPERAPLEVNKAASSARFLSHQSRRQSLPPLPEFPSEQQLIEARDAWYRDQKDAITRWLLRLVHRPGSPPTQGS